MRFYALYIAVLVYALFSNPTPDVVGIAEIAVAGFLFLAVGVVSIPAIVQTRYDSTALSFHRIFFLWMMSVPLIIGVINGHAATDIMRDVIPIVFLILPLCFTDNINATDIERLNKIIVLSGVLFAARYLWTAAPYIVQTGGLSPAPHDMLYLANSPLIPFAAIMGMAWMTKPQGWYWTHRLMGLVVFSVCILAMIAMVQRAPFILTLAASAVICFIRIGHSPVRVTLLVILIVAAIYPLWPFAVNVWESIVNKTLAVGWNNRLAETGAVREIIWRGDATDSILGFGWGSLWQSPAVSDAWVRFTHNMMSYYWLKAGIIGLAMSVVFFILWLRDGLGLLRHNIVMALAIMVPLIIHSLLYTGFKTLDYAVLLLLLSLHTTRLWPINRQSSY